MSLGILDLETRSVDSAWRDIGYLINMDTAQTGDNPIDKINDYHATLAIILSGIKEIQDRGGIAWTLPFKGKRYDVVLKMPIIFITGDTEGQDKLVGKFANRANVKALCRMCSCPFESTGDPDYNFVYFKQKDITRMMNNKEVENLREISHHCLERNILHEIQFCHPTRGLRAAVAIDFLHVIQEGWHIRCLEGLFGAKRVYMKVQKKNAKKRAVAGIKEQGSVYNAADDEDDRSNWAVFTERQKKKFDWTAMKYGRSLQHQSDSDLPRCYFPSGICNNARKAGHENEGVLLLCLCMFVSSEGVKMEEAVGPEVLSNFIRLIEILIMLEEFIKCRRFARKDLHRFKDFSRSILDQFKRTYDRKAGTKHNVIKLHLLLHFADEILNNGPALGFDSGCGEHGHIQRKKAAKNTQRREDSLHYQAGTRIMENIAIDFAFNNLHLVKREHVVIRKNDKIQFSGNSYFANINGIYNQKKKPPFIEAKWSSLKCIQHVFQFIRDHVFPHIHDDRVELYTQFRVLNSEDDEDDAMLNDELESTPSHSQIYRAHPAYGAASWQDWANINWGKADGIIPIHMLVFIKIEKIKHSFIVGGCVIDKPGFYAISHLLAQSLTSKPHNSDEKNFLAHQDSNLVYWARKMLNPISKKPRQKTDDYKAEQNLQDPLIAMVDSNTITGPCIAVPYDIDGCDDPHSYLFVKSRNSWPDVFTSLM
jgi:hypothetical protein